MKGLKPYIIAGIIFVSVIGTLFHFVYAWTGNNIIAGIFVPINESVWEHTKLIFLPMLMYCVYLNKKISTGYPYINSAMVIGQIIGVLSIIILFYTYSGIIGYNISFVDISIFFISVLLAFYAVYKSAITITSNRYDIILRIIRFVFICIYIIFTFYPPGIPLFVG